jgi:hypothetical protein
MSIRQFSSRLVWCCSQQLQPLWPFLEPSCASASSVSCSPSKILVPRNLCSWRSVLNNRLNKQRMRGISVLLTLSPACPVGPLPCAFHKALIRSNDLTIWPCLSRTPSHSNFKMFLKQLRHYHQVHCCQAMITFPGICKLLQFLLL